MWYTIAIGFACFYVQSKPSFCFVEMRLTMHVQVQVLVMLLKSNHPPAKKPKTLMDFAYSETSLPRFKNTDQVTYFDKYSPDYASDSENSVKDLNNYIKNCKIQAKVLQSDCLLILFKKHCNGVFAQNVTTFESLCQAVRDLLWYVGPHYDKLE